MENPYKHTNSPFDKRKHLFIFFVRRSSHHRAAFYLIIDLAVGGTSGWFPDGVGDKPWFDTSGNAAAMLAFAEAQKEWSATWPSDEDDVAFRIDSVKMYKLKSDGKC